MFVKALILAVYTLLSAGPLMAASIQLEGENGTFTFAMTRAQSESPFSIVLQVYNADADLTLAIWQLELELRPTASAVGELKFGSTFAPPMSLFGEFPGPLSDLAGPNPHVNIFDGDLVGMGQSIPHDAARNIVGLTLEAAEGTIGTFQLVMPIPDLNAPTQGSSYLPFGADEPVPFTNHSASNFDGYLLLGSITVQSVPESSAVQLFIIAMAVLAPSFRIRGIDYIFKLPPCRLKHNWGC